MNTFQILVTHDTTKSLYIYFFIGPLIHKDTLLHFEEKCLLTNTYKNLQFLITAKNNKTIKTDNQGTKPLDKSLFPMRW